MCQQLSNLGEILQLQGDYAHAEQKLREGLALLRRLGYRTNQNPVIVVSGSHALSARKDSSGGIPLLEDVAC